MQILSLHQQFDILHVPMNMQFPRPPPRCRHVGDAGDGDGDIVLRTVDDREHPGGCNVLRSTFHFVGVFPRRQVQRRRSGANKVITITR